MGLKAVWQIDVDTTHGRVIIAMHNGGNSIAKVERTKIFQYLKRRHPSNRDDQPVWGIVLSFVQDDVGKVVVNSSEPAGTVFSIDIPRGARGRNID